MLEQQFMAGVHETLVTLHELNVEPFHDGGEGDQFHDFIGRLDNWPWQNK